MRKILITMIISVFLLSTSFLTSSHPAHNSNSTELYSTLLSSTVLIETERGSLGSGFLISPQMIITNFHVVEIPEEETLNTEVNIFLFGGTISFSGSVVFVAPEHDLALVMSSLSFDSYLPLARTSFIEPLSEVLVAGFPLGSPLFVSEGRYQGPARNPEYLVISAPVAPGNSGGPVVWYNESTRRYEVIGVASAMMGSFFVYYPHLALARPVERVHELINKHRRYPSAEAS